MKTKIKLLIITILLALCFSTICFATSDVPSLVSKKNEIVNQLISSDTSNSINTIPKEIQDIIDSDGSIDLLDDIGDSDVELSDDELISSYPGYLDDDYFLIGDDIIINDSINGNVYLIGDEIEISSEQIDGNVFIIANTLKINTDIYMSLYAIANSVDIESGEIVDAYLIANSVNIGKEASIDRDAKIICDKLNMNGVIYKNLYCMSQNATINGVIDGKLTYTGNLQEGEEANISESQKIEIEVENNFQERLNAFVVALKRIMLIWKMITGSIIVLIIFLLTKSCIRINKTSEEEKLYYTEKTFSDNDIIKLLKGLAYIVLCFIAIIILFITVIGIPVGLLLLLVYCVTLYIATPVACIEIAKFIKIKMNSKGKLKAVIALISIALYILLVLFTRVPHVGALIYNLVGLYGLGTIVDFVFFRKNKKEKCSAMTNTCSNNEISVEKETDNNQNVVENDNTDNNDNN